MAAWVVDMLLVLAIDVCGGSDAEAALAMLLIGAKGEGVVPCIGETCCTCAEDDDLLLGVVDVTSDGPLASTGDVCEGCGADSAALETQLIGHGRFSGIDNLQEQTSVASVMDRMFELQGILEFDPR